MKADLENVKKLPLVATYQTHEEFRVLADQSLESKEKMIYYMGGVENLVAVFDEQYEREFYIPTRLERNIGLKLLIPDGQAADDYREQDAQEDRETRLIRQEMMMDSSFMIYDDTVVFFAEAEEQYALEVKAPSLAKAMKTLFNDVWKHTQ